jgi:hypothetical protein
MLPQKGASVTLAITAQEPQNVTEAAPFCFAFFNCQTFKGEFLLLGEAVCSCWELKLPAEIYGGLWLPACGRLARR